MEYPTGMTVLAHLTCLGHDPRQCYHCFVNQKTLHWPPHETKQTNLVAGSLPLKEDDY